MSANPALESADQLTQLRNMTTVVADTGDFNDIKRLAPQDATTNPSLLLKAVSQPDYAHLLDDALQATAHLPNPLQAAQDHLAVALGLEILNVIPGRVSTEVDARLSFDTDATVAKAKRLLELYQQQGADTSRVLIKIASTWEGIQAARQLEAEGIHCNLTLLFNFAQAVACAEAGVFLISPFVGRILDWYKAQDPAANYVGDADPGVQSVRQIYQYYKANGYKTLVMGASFRNADEIRALAGCDLLTISPALLDELQAAEELLPRALSPSKTAATTQQEALTAAEFRWALNDDPMASEKLADGIRRFAQDQRALEALLQQRL